MAGWRRTWAALVSALMHHGWGLIAFVVFTVIGGWNTIFPTRPVLLPEGLSGWVYVGAGYAALIYVLVRAFHDVHEDHWRWTSVFNRRVRLIPRWIPPHTGQGPVAWAAFDVEVTGGEIVREAWVEIEQNEPRIHFAWLEGDTFKDKTDLHPHKPVTMPLVVRAVQEDQSLLGHPLEKGVCYITGAKFLMDSRHQDFDALVPNSQAHAALILARMRIVLHSGGWSQPFCLALHVPAADLPSHVSHLEIVC